MAVLHWQEFGKASAGRGLWLMEAPNGYMAFLRYHSAPLTPGWYVDVDVRVDVADFGSSPVRLEAPLENVWLAKLEARKVFLDAVLHQKRKIDEVWQALTGPDDDDE